MRRNFIPFSVAALALGLAIGLAQPLVSAGARGGDVIVLTEKETGGGEINHGDDAFGPGDGFTFTSDLFEGSKKVGTDSGVCTVADIAGESDAVLHCLATLELKDGRIMVQAGGLFTESPAAFTTAVVGGTGRYAGAKGTMEVDEAGHDTTLTLHLVD